MRHKSYQTALILIISLLTGYFGIIVDIHRLEESCYLTNSCLNTQSNAAWLGVDWVNEKHSTQELETLVYQLNERKIRHVYVFVSYLKPDGRFNQTYSTAVDLTHTLHTTDSSLDVQAWIGLPLKDSRGLGYIDLTDEATRRQVVDFCRELVQNMGFDGIHLDPEPVVSGDPTLLTLLDQIRQGIGQKAVLSIASRRIQPFELSSSVDFLDRFTWRASYYQEVARHVDQMAVMVYDSGVPFAWLYRWWTTHQVVQICQALDQQRVDLFFGVPTSEERTWTHWPNAENMESGVQGIIDGLSRTEKFPRGTIGIAIYPYWETDEREWTVYRSLWLRQ